MFTAREFRLGWVAIDASPLSQTAHGMALNLGDTPKDGRGGCKGVEPLSDDEMPTVRGMLCSLVRRSNGGTMEEEQELLAATVAGSGARGGVVGRGAAAMALAAAAALALAL